MALDGFGLRGEGGYPRRVRATGLRAVSFRRARTTRARRDAVHRVIDRAVRHHAPTEGVIAEPSVVTAEHTELRAFAEEALRERGVPVRRVPLRHARRVLLGRVHGAEPEALASTLARTFFPALASELGGSAHARRYRRHAWNALAVAVVHLAEEAPRATWALMVPGVPVPVPLRDLLIRADKAHHPSDYASIDPPPASGASAGP